MFDNIRARRREAKKNELVSQSKRRIEVADLDGKLFIAFDGNPIFPIEDEWTTKEIINQLRILRDNYVTSKMSESGRGVCCF